jgi:hippurate hydrolase
MVFRTDVKPFDDVRVRRAVRMAVDRQALLNLVAGADGGVVGCDTPVSPVDQYRSPKTCAQDIAGAKKMMEDGLFLQFPCKAIFAMHNMPGQPQGHLVLRDGSAMASSDNVTITLHGKGGHGAMPHLAADPVVAGSAIVMGLQSIVARNVDPQHMAIITVGAFQAGVANNVIPQTATLRLSVRSLDRDVRVLLEQRITELVHAEAQSYGVTADIDYQRGYPVLVNHPAETEFARTVAEELVGPARVLRQGPALTGSEDFAFMLEQVPGSYVLIGNGQGPGDG